MKVRIDMTGRRFGRLVGQEFAFRRGGHAHWVFRCDCGALSVASGAAVRAGNTRSCGCLHREVSAERLTTHGRRSAKQHDPTYRAWQEMKIYCANAGSPRYPRFGGKGIDVCRTWRDDFARFLRDMGERPEGAILGRIDENQDFGPANCRWESRFHAASTHRLQADLVTS